MSDRLHVELFRTGGEWNWRVVDHSTVLLVGTHPVGSSGTLREQVENVQRLLREREVPVRRAEPDVPPSLDRTDSSDRPLSPHDADPEFRVVPVGQQFWLLLVVSGAPIGTAPVLFDEPQHATRSAEQIETVFTGAAPTYESEEGTENTPGEPQLTIGTGAKLRKPWSLFTRGIRYRRTISAIDTRIVVAGIRGKSSTARRLGEVFYRRGNDTLTKITGNRPHLVHNGRHIPIVRRGPRVTLYENLSVVLTHAPDDVLILENHALTEYTTRLIHERFIQPDVVLLTNIRQDHQDTLGNTRQQIARSFARSIPPNTHVISGEQNEVLHEYLAKEIEWSSGTVSQVSIPDRHRGLIGAETIYAVDELLAYLDEAPLSNAEIEAALTAMQPRWTHVPGGRVYNAAEVNDIESTEQVRQTLAGNERIRPFVYLRGDRRSRSASFARYLSDLASRGLTAEIHAAGRYVEAFADSVDGPVTVHDESERPADVLDTLLAGDQPIVLMGNTVEEFMREFELELRRRAAEVVSQEGPTVTKTPR